MLDTHRIQKYVSRVHQHLMYSAVFVVHSQICLEYKEMDGAEEVLVIKIEMLLPWIIL